MGVCLAPLAIASCELYCTRFSPQTCRALSMTWMACIVLSMTWMAFIVLSMTWMVLFNMTYIRVCLAALAIASCEIYCTRFSPQTCRALSMTWMTCIALSRTWIACIVCL